MAGAFCCDFCDTKSFGEIDIFQKIEEFLLSIFFVCTWIVKRIVEFIKFILGCDQNCKLGVSTGNDSNIFSRLL